MYEYLKVLLREVEKLIPPPPNCHHVLMVLPVEFPVPDFRVCMQLSYGDGNWRRCVFDAEDFKMSAPDLAAAIHASTWLRD